MATVDDLMLSIHPTVVEQVERSLRGTFVLMLAKYAEGQNQLAQLEMELAQPDILGSW